MHSSRKPSRTQKPDASSKREPPPKPDVRSLLLIENASGNGEDFDRQGFKDFIAEFRSTVFDRQLISQSFVVVPDDARGITGDVAHNVELSGIQQGTDVIIRIVAVLRIIFDHKMGKRLINMESFVLQTEET